MNEATMVYAGHTIPVLGCYDTVIVGGGSTGVSAGICAAQGGCRTMLVEKSIRLGGTCTNALVTPMMKSFTGHYSNFYAIENRLKQHGCVVRDSIGTEMRWFNAETMAQSIEELYLEAGGEILYDAALCDCLVEQAQIQCLILATAQGLCAVYGKQYVDASGDAVLAHAAGAPVDAGDENGNNQMSSLRFEMGGIDIEAYRKYVFSLGDTYSIFTQGEYYESAMVGGRNFVLEPLFQAGVAEGLLHPEDLRYYQTFSLPGKPGCLSFNCPHLATLTKNTSAMARSRAITEGRQMIHRLVLFLQKKMPGFEHSFLLQEASMLGVRESWRLNGVYCLTEEDYTQQARFADGVARGDWYIDVHSATKGLFHQNNYRDGDYYEIPYRSMICRQVENLVVAGRCISATFLMQASIRILPTVIDMGQAAGAACALAQKNKIPLNRVDGTHLRENLGEMR
ncbi:MAG: FAD-dependent oxidoreductase [Gemmiger sp.]|nr:FAD-dependent oxidoreductase [Gemmiger sp.]